MSLYFPSGFLGCYWVSQFGLRTPNPTSPNVPGVNCNWFYWVNWAEFHHSGLFFAAHSRFQTSRLNSPPWTAPCFPLSCYWLIVFCPLPSFPKIQVTLLASSSDLIPRQKTNPLGGQYFHKVCLQHLRGFGTKVSDLLDLVSVLKVTWTLVGFEVNNFRPGSNHLPSNRATTKKELKSGPLAQRILNSHSILDPLF